MINKGSVVTGRVTSLQDYGVFVQVDDYVGLIHISEISDRFVRDVRDYLAVGDVVDLKVIEIDESEKKLRLSYKAIRRRSINKHYEIGFKSIEEKFDGWVEQKKEEMKNDV